MRVKFKKWAIDYLNISKINQFDLSNDSNEELNSFILVKKTFLEIGPGKGDFIISFANKNPQFNFVVVELNRTVAGICLKKIDESKLTNIRLIVGDFYKFANQIKQSSIEGLFLNFSDPWPKHHHESRRLTSDKFLMNYALILKLNAKIYQKTDNIDFFNYSLKQYEKNKWKIISTDFEYNSNDIFDAETAFEVKFKAQGIKINRAIVQKTKDTIFREEKNEIRNIL